MSQNTHQMTIIPAIDLLGGRCVRLLHGDYDKVTYYDVDPVELAQRYCDGGARQIHIVDLDGAKGNSDANLQIIEAIAAINNLSVQTGGGVRSREDVGRRLEAGVERVVTGSMTIKQPAEVATWLGHFGAGHLTLALDVRLDDDGVPRVATEGWREQSDVSLWDAVGHINELSAQPIEHLLCTDIARDGAMTGPNVELYQTCLQKLPGIKLQASGGVRNVADAQTLASTGVAGMITGKALLENTLTLEELKPFLQNA